MAKRAKPRPPDRQRPADEGSKLAQFLVQILQVVVPLVVTAAWARLSHLPAVVNWLLALGLLCYLAWWLRRYRKRRLDRLRIQNPDKLSITEEDLRGRDGDSRRLVKLLEDFPVVFLSGESGCGKTTLIDWKIIPALSDRFAVAKIDSYGSDWIADPLRRLMQRLEPALDTAGDTATLLSRLEARLAGPGRPTLLIFDQFDYYLVTCHQHLIDDAGVVIDSAALAASNGFWRCIHSQAEQGRLKCLFVIERSQHVFASPFGPEAKDYPLPRLLATYSSGIISDVLGRAGISTDDVSKLVDRIAEDLDPQWLLPVQLDFTLRSLQHLGRITVRNYNRVGGLTGLIALSVSTEIRQVAESVGISYLTALDSLCQLLDESTAKPRIVRASQLAIPAGSGIAPYLALLDQLSDRRITKPQGDEAGEPSWTLYHEFLVSELLALRSAALGQEQALERSYARFTRAKGPRKLRHLLSLPAALKLLLARRSAYGRSRLGFLLLSLGLWLLVIVSPIVAGYEVFQARRAVALAADRVSSFDTDGNLTAEEVKALWLLNQDSPRVKVETLREFLSNDTNAHRLASHAGVLMQSILGLGPERIEHQLVDVWRELCSDNLQNLQTYQLVACAVIENEVAQGTATTWQRYLGARAPDDLLLSLFLALPPPARQQAMTALHQGLQKKTLYLVNQAELIRNLLAAMPLSERASYGEDLLATPGLADSPSRLLDLYSALPADFARDIQPLLTARALQLLAADPARTDAAQRRQWAEQVARFAAGGWDLDDSIALEAQQVLTGEFRKHLTDDEALNLIADLAPFSGRLSPADSAAAKSRFLGVLTSDCTSSRWPFRTAWIVESFTPAETAQVFEWIERKPLTFFMDFNRVPQEPQLLAGTMWTLERLALHLGDDERSRMLGSLGSRIRAADDLRSSTHLIVTAFALQEAEHPPRTSSLDVGREIGRLWLRSRSEFAQDGDVLLLARLLWPRLDARSRREIAALLVRVFRENILKPDRYSAPTVAAALDELGISLSGPESLAILESLLEQGWLPCDALGPLVGTATARLFVEQGFRYPLCPLGMSRAVVAKFEGRAIFKAAEVGWSTPGGVVLSRRKLADWADARGYRRDQQPRFGGVY